MAILITNGTVVNPGGKSGKLDVLIREGRIEAIGASLLEDERLRLLMESDMAMGEFIEINAIGQVIMPGLVDTHVHFRDPGQTWKEDIETGANAAKMGGFTSVVMMANTTPPIDDTETLDYVLKKGQSTGIKVYTCANVTREMAGTELTDMEALHEAGAVGFTDDGNALMDCELVCEAMLRAKNLGVPISFHEEDSKWVGIHGYNDEWISRQFGFKGAHRLAEISLINRDVNLALATGARICIQHISTAEGVEFVKAGKMRGGDIHAEATPHHFTLTEADVLTHGTLAKMNPPLRTSADRQRIIEGLQDGTIEIIATDHAPHTTKEKQKGITVAPSGIIGLETSLALSLRLVHEGKLSMEQLVRLMSYNPARIYNLEAGVIEVGKSADITVVDPIKEWVVGCDFASKSQNSPFTGWTMRGRAEVVICDGQIVMTRK